MSPNGERQRAQRKHHTKMLEKWPQAPEGALLLGTGDVLFHVVQGILGDSPLQDEVLQLMTIAVVLDASSNFAEAIQEDFVISTMVFIIPRRA